MNDEAAESYRKALAADPDLSMAQLGLERLGLDVAPAAVPLSGLGKSGWVVLLEKGRFFASNESYPGLRVPLEMAGKGQPRILAWELRDETYKGIGVLRYAAGTVPGVKAPVETEYAALLDVRSGAILAVEPHRRADAVSRWSWNDGSLTVVALDGLTTVHTFRRAAAPRPATTATGGVRPRVRETSRRRGTPWSG